MTLNEFILILESENVRHDRVNGFSLSYSDSHAVLKGRIPLSLARKINEGIDNSVFKICVHGDCCDANPDNWATNTELTDIFETLIEKWKNNRNFGLLDAYHEALSNYIQNAEAENRLDDIYVLYYNIYTEEGIRHVIKCIRESGYVNQCIYS